MRRWPLQYIAVRGGDRGDATNAPSQATSIRGPQHSVDEIVTGQAAVRRRRYAIAAAAAVVALVVAGSFAVFRTSLFLSPGDEPSTPPLQSTSAAALGLDVLSGGVIHRPDGSEVALALPDGVTAYGAESVAGGWLVATSPRDELWFASGGASARLIGKLTGGHAVSADGRVLVMVNDVFSMTADFPEVIAYELPFLAVLDRRVVDIEGLGTEAGTTVVGVSGERVLLRQLKFIQACRAPPFGTGALAH